MPVLTAFFVSRKVKRLQKRGSSRPRLVAVVKCIGNDLICWQVVSVKATKRLPCLPFQPKAGKRLTVSTLNLLKFKFPTKTTWLPWISAPVNHQVKQTQTSHF